MGLNRALARHAPALVVVDDLRRADRDSLAWLAFAVRRLPRTGIAVIAVANDPLPAEAIVLRPQPLSQRAVAALLHVELGHTVSARFVAALPPGDGRAAAAGPGARGRRPARPRARDRGR